jgi:hypothetical protein
MCGFTFGAGPMCPGLYLLRKDHLRIKSLAEVSASTFVIFFFAPRTRTRATRRTERLPVSDANFASAGKGGEMLIGAIIGHCLLEVEA